MKRRIELLSKVPLFRALNDNEIEKLAEVVIFKRYEKNESWKGNQNQV